MNVEIKSIPHEEHRYETVGDYWQEDGKLKVRVSDMGNEDYHFLVALHELIEEHLTRKRGIAEPDIKAFDEMYEAERERGLHGPEEEPGHDPRAPYRREHVFAECIERLVAQELGVDWEVYGETVMEL